jgi:hypothetical protein
MPPPSITIEPRVGGGPVVQLIPCAGVTVTMTMPGPTRIFEGQGIRGLNVPWAENGLALVIHEDGTLEYNSPWAEYSLVLPRGLADELYAAFAGRNGQALENVIELPGENAPAPEEEEENPQVNPNPEGGRKRRSRVKKQTRRTQRKRRNTVRR